MFRSGKFSLWCDFVEREFIAGQFDDIVRAGVVNGATSNPAIFKEAIMSSPAYKADISAMAGAKPKEIYENLAIKDIRNAAQKLLLNFFGEDDGFISIEVDPHLSDDEDATFKEGKRLYSAIGMPNVMIKIPATKAGYGAMSRLMAKGINVNATLVFSPSQTKKCLRALYEGSKEFKKKNKGATLPRAVISIFVSRFDRALDAKFEAAGVPKGKFGIYNATKCYKIIEDEKFDNIKALFASTGVKGDEYPADYYVSELMYKNAVNTAPLGTIRAFHAGSHAIREVPGKKEISAFFERAKGVVSIDKIYDDLLTQGLKQFETAFDEMINSIK